MSRPLAISIGDEFGRLRAIAMLTERCHGSVIWQCLCAPDLGGCGRTTTVSTRYLRAGNTRSCGCLASESRHKTGRTTPAPNRTRGKGVLGGKSNAEHMRSRYQRWVNAGRCGTCGRPPVPLHIQCAACIERKRRKTNV